MLMYSQLDWLTSARKVEHSQFHYLMKKPQILNKIAIFLQEKYGCFDKSMEKAPFTRVQLEWALLQCDHDLYVQFRNKDITFDQLRSRIAERSGIAKYSILDDLKDQLDPNFLEPNNS